MVDEKQKESVGYFENWKFVERGWLALFEFCSWTAESSKKHLLAAVSDCQNSPGSARRSPSTVVWAKHPQGEPQAAMCTVFFFI